MYRYVGRMMSDIHSQACTVEFSDKLDIVPGCVNNDVLSLANSFMENWLYDEKVEKIMFVRI